MLTYLKMSTATFSNSINAKLCPTSSSDFEQRRENKTLPMKNDKQLSNHSPTMFSHSLPLLYNRSTADDDCLDSHSLPCLGEVCR
jgi:hypothetical protein